MYANIVDFDTLSGFNKADTARFILRTLIQVRYLAPYYLFRIALCCKRLGIDIHKHLTITRTNLSFFFGSEIGLLCLKKMHLLQTLKLYCLCEFEYVNVTISDIEQEVINLVLGRLSEFLIIHCNPNVFQCIKM
eukprot:Pgem_evm1s13589